MIGLVLGAGGYVGRAFHAGVLSALAAETGWDPASADVLVGTSAGSLAVADLRAGFTAADLLALEDGTPLSDRGSELRAAMGPSRPLAPRRRASSAAGDQGRAGRAPAPRRTPSAPALVRTALLHPRRIRPAAVVSGLLPAGTTSTEPISEGFERLFADRWPALPTLLCAVRLRDGQRVVFGAPGAPPARLAQAVAASCAIPGYLEPVLISGERYLDGGVHSPSNADVLLGRGLSTVVVSSPMSIAPGAVSLRRPDTAGRLAVRRYLSQEVAALRAEGVEVLVLQPGPKVLAVAGQNPMRRGTGGPIAAAAALETLVALRSGGTGRRLAAALRTR